MRFSERKHEYISQVFIILSKISNSLYLYKKNRISDETDIIFISITQVFLTLSKLQEWFIFVLETSLAVSVILASRPGRTDGMLPYPQKNILTQSHSSQALCVSICMYVYTNVCVYVCMLLDLVVLNRSRVLSQNPYQASNDTIHKNCHDSHKVILLVFVCLL